MTKLSYKIGNFETASYTEAMKIAKETGHEIERVYTPVVETAKVDPVMREKRLAAIRKKAAEKRAH